ncbi:MAG: ComEC/Rec2 family competence protein [Phycisphaeraceae bacterium]|nr:ComEC/Rec2 family competence protein [Phycisphaeraceae bacterium]
MTTGPPDPDATTQPQPVAPTLPSPAVRAATISPFISLALACVVGIIAGTLWRQLLPFLIAGGITSLIACVMLIAGRSRGARCWGVLALSCSMAAWTVVREEFTSANDVRRFLSNNSQLVQLSGTVDGVPFLSAPAIGGLAQFSYKPPGTLFFLDVDSILVDGVMQPSSGKLLAKVAEADHELRAGDRIQAAGWLRTIEGPVNPGERDYRQFLADRGVYGRLSMGGRENYSLIGRSSVTAALPLASRWLSDAAAQSLRVGMTPDAGRIALLDALILGRWSSDLSEVDDSFRQVGLAHILSISGTHLTILLAVVWFAARLVSRRPNRACIAVLLVLGLYLVLVPPQVPLTRAGIMAATFAVGFASGRRVRGIDMLALAGVIVLVWRPNDLFNAGCQLSFVGVAALLLFARPVGRWIWAEPSLPDTEMTRQQLVARTVADYTAANVVAASLSLPLVAYHFGVVAPLAVLLSMIVLPLVTGVLALGFLKVIVGLMLPSLAALLAWPLERITDAMIRFTSDAAHWPAASVQLAEPPSLVWTLAAVAVLVALFAGLFARRKLALASAVSISAIWLFWPHAPSLIAAHLAPVEHQPAVTINMFDVGDGSCFLVRLTADPRTPAQTIMFDCGSMQYLDIGKRSIAPGLAALRVSRIDTLFISHADMDHYCGIPELIDQVSVSRIVLTPQFLDEAAEYPRGPAALLLLRIRERHIPILKAEAGWHEFAGGADLELLWPRENFRTRRANDASMVLSIRAAGRRVLLSGDVQQESIPLLLAAHDLRADVADLPHHGSFVESSPAWYRAVSPRFVLQSSGPARLLADHWNALIDPQTTRLITDRTGMVDLVITRSGDISCSTFKPDTGTSR